MTDLTLTLGGVEFQDFEIPDAIRGFGGEQMLNVHRLPGGARVIDAMGRDDGQIEWSGRFRGSDALSRARAVDELRIAGQSVFLSFGDVLETVLVHRFSYSIERLYEVPYVLVLEVLSDDSSSAQGDGPGVDEMIDGDSDSLGTLGSGIGDSGLSGALSSVTGAVSQVQSFATAAREQLATVTAPIQTARAQAATLIASTEGVIGGTSLPGSLQGALSDLLGGSLP